MHRVGVQARMMIMKAASPIVQIKAVRLSHGMGLALPTYQTEEAAGMDLLAAVPLTSPLRLLPGMRQLVPTWVWSQR